MAFELRLLLLRPWLPSPVFCSLSGGGGDDDDDLAWFGTATVDCVTGGVGMLLPLLLVARFR